MNDQIPKQLKADRVRRLTELENELEPIITVNSSELNWSYSSNLQGAGDHSKDRPFARTSEATGW